MEDASGEEDGDEDGAFNETDDRAEDGAEDADVSPDGGEFSDGVTMKLLPKSVVGHGPNLVTSSFRVSSASSQKSTQRRRNGMDEG